ncbi:hypothetical protein BSKO_10058 [Bryopsis sp. KO-2023]|nr:hypothetical protein BSKO_10058 [Bryopsis sp. KO-2023]
MATPMEAIEFTPDPVESSPYQDPVAQQLLQKHSLRYEFRHGREVEAVRHLAESLEGKETEAELWMEHALATTREYREEGDRLAEQLEVVGISKDILDTDATTNLEFVANAAEILGTREAGSQEMLLCWTDLVIDDIESKEEHRSLSRCLSMAKRESERATAVASQMKSAVNLMRKKTHDAVRFEEEAGKFKQQAFADGKRAEETALMEKENLKSSGYGENVQIDRLLASLEELKEKKLQLERADKQRAMFHDLPLDVEGARVMLENAQRHYQEIARTLETKTV